MRAEKLSADFDESTGLSWFWAFLFNPIYFIWYGFWKQAIILIFLNFVFIGFIIAPFLAYPAWRGRALKKAEEYLLAGGDDGQQQSRFLDDASRH